MTFQGMTDPKATCMSRLAPKLKHRVPYHLQAPRSSANVWSHKNYVCALHIHTVNGYMLSVQDKDIVLLKGKLALPCRVCPQGSMRS